MEKLLSDFAKTEISNKVMDTLRAYLISNWHSEPCHQNHNPAEWRYRTINSRTNTVMNRSLFQIGILSPATRIIILLNGGTGLLIPGPIQ